MSDERGPDPREMSQQDRALAARIDRLLRETAGVYAAVRVGGGVVYLDGVVESAAQRDAATDLAGELPGVARVQNDLEIEEFGLPGDRVGAEEQTRGDISYRMLEGEMAENAVSLEEQTEVDLNEAVPTIGGDVTSDTMIAVEEGIPYVPPTDPVVRPSRDEQTIAIVGGFGTSSDEEYPDQLATTALGDAPPGDDDLRQEVIQALRADAATTDLIIDVAVRNGVARLRGEVQTLEDAEFAEEVAGRVPGIREVIEELIVPGLG